MKPKCEKVISGPKFVNEPCKACDKAGPSLRLPRTWLCLPCKGLFETKYLARGLCIRRGCRKKAANGGILCYRHAKIRWAARNPVKYTWMVLRNNARRRKKLFDLTLPQFAWLVYRTGYMVHKGKGALDLTIDRIRNEDGYTYTNLRVISNQANGTKRDQPLTETTDSKVPF